MQIIGIITEYNPFHNGHVHHIKEIKKRYPDSLIIAIINGYFTQRGTISILSKEDKTKIALNHEIDIVLELPFVFGTQSADIFAENAIKIANALHINRVIFGSETDDIKFLKQIVDKQEEDSLYDEKVKQFLKEGYNYPTAMKKALNIKEDLTNPNDLLGISYIKAIKKINSSIIPETIKRTNNYHDTSANNSIISATNIRERFYRGENLTNYLPTNVIPFLHNITNNKLLSLFKYKVITEKDLSIYLDVDEGIEHRIKKYIYSTSSFDELIKNIKTKRYTYNKISRMLLHILIGLTKEDNKNIKLDYIKILGFNTKGRSYLKLIKEAIPFPTKPTEHSLIFKYELMAAYLFEQATNKKLNTFDIKNKPIQKG